MYTERSFENVDTHLDARLPILSLLLRPPAPGGVSPILQYWSFFECIFKLHTRILKRIRTREGEHIQVVYFRRRETRLRWWEGRKTISTWVSSWTTTIRSCGTSGSWLSRDGVDSVLLSGGPGADVETSCSSFFPA